ncbi:MAG: hypothetical protein ACNA8W_13990 [Bradymonadaceae bacterium]
MNSTSFNVFTLAIFFLILGACQRGPLPVDSIPDPSPPPVETAPVEAVEEPREEPEEELEEDAAELPPRVEVNCAETPELLLCRARRAIEARDLVHCPKKEREKCFILTMTNAPNPPACMDMARLGDDADWKRIDDSTKYQLDDLILDLCAELMAAAHHGAGHVEAEIEYFYATYERKRAMF